MEQGSPLSAHSSSVDDGVRTWSGGLPTWRRGTAGPAFSVGAMVATLVAGSLGTSVVTASFIAAAAGPIPAVLLMLVVAALSRMSAGVLVRGGKRTHADVYAQIVEEEFGGAAATIAELLTLFCLFCAAASHIFTLVEFLSRIQVGGLVLMAETSRVTRTALVVVAMFPLTLIANVSWFGLSSIVVCVCCFIALCAMVARMCVSFWLGQLRFNVENLLAVHPAGIFLALPLVSFNFAYHFILTDVLCQLNRPSMIRISTALSLTTVTLLALYIPSALTGFVLFGGDNVPASVLDWPQNHTDTLAMTLWPTVLLWIASYPLLTVPLRRSIERLYFSVETEAISLRRVTAAVVLSVFAFVMVLVQTDLTLINAVSSGSMALLVYFFPGLLSLRASVDTRKAKYDLESRRSVYIGLTATLMGVIVCFLGILQSIP
uniref:Amino acid transporter transmembrane domain-containing protein n=1 Tax=Compsopogon caeruleus TaxID=31354 RepID=A0A7S1XFA0_9RHOD|mmetsp:Transcript_2391/g.4137  ORF Transcript_2391/g.4137 Transcript_2391/m.4137 type:complete len:432 (+) Transcript_2391:74-1369(+)